MARGKGHCRTEIPHQRADSACIYWMWHLACKNSPSKEYFMSNILVQKVNSPEKQALPIFAEIGKRMEDVRRRAHELFHLRVNGEGSDLSDWLTAEREIFGWAKAELAMKNNAYEIQLALPGFDAKDVEVTATHEEIVVHAAAKHQRQETSDPSIVWSEFGTNELYRRFDLPKSIALDKVSAKLDKGILLITAPYAVEAKAAA